ncbi:hypothetical protein [Paenibacillus sp. P22]|uniref:hypothetical protein n=1 Tax=Paenibacillus sp. P22 TaxID=483908 RepID=UPI0004361105|nr:hypothetical protein [Paenibacillus sp. P22]CDN46181.1 hypothetical protein BN871_LG_00050 [Paenibacillus sp. P22]
MNEGWEASEKKDRHGAVLFLLHGDGGKNWAVYLRQGNSRGSWSGTFPFSSEKEQTERLIHRLQDSGHPIELEKQAKTT